MDGNPLSTLSSVSICYSTADEQRRFKFSVKFMWLEEHNAIKM